MAGVPEPVSPSTVQTAHRVRLLVGRLRRRLREVGSDHELTPSQTSVLSRLDTGGAASMSDLAVAEGVRPQSMSATLAVLHERGLVRRDPDPDDGRRLLVSVTTEARAWVAGERQVREEWLSRALQDRFTAAERARIDEALDLLDRLSEHPDHP